jgi:hypothetical protein
MTSTLAAGSRAMVATYSGDSNYYGSASTTLSQVVASPQLHVSSNLFWIIIKDGQQGTVQLRVSATGPVASAVTFTCSGLPADAGCTFSPFTVTSLPATVSMRISTTKSDARLQWTNQPRWAAIALLLPGLLLLPVGPRKRKRAIWLIAGLAVLLAFSVSGCGSSSGGGRTYGVVVTASAADVMSDSTMISVSVNE